MFMERLDSDATAAPEPSTSDQKCTEKLERELRNCLQEIEFLQDELNVRNAEVDFMADHVRSLELKLTGVETLHERLRLMGDELSQSDARHFLLMRELDFKDQELQTSASRIKNLESMIFDCQCEIESLKLDITALEQRCFEAERISRDIMAERAMKEKQIQELDTHLKEMQKAISLLESDKKELEEKAMLVAGITEQSYLNVEEQVVNWLTQTNTDSQSDQNVQPNLGKELILSRIMSNSEDNVGQFLSKLVAIAGSDGHVKNEIEKMENQMNEYEHLVKQLKKELGEEKLKAKDEAEDLIQEMAELRYQLTGMLEEESKRRAFVEQASIQKIQDLEAEVEKEKMKSVAALRRFQEVNELAERQSIEIQKLKKAIERLHLPANFDTDHRTEPCTCGYCNTSQDSLVTDPSIDTDALEVIISEKSGRALLEWYPDEASMDKHLRG